MAHGASDSDDPPDDADESSKTSRNSVLSEPPKTLFAEVSISHDRLVLVPTIESVPEATIQMEGTPVGGSTPFVSVVTDDFVAFERALEVDPTVSETTLFSSSADRRVYQLHLAPSVTPFLPTAADLGVRILDVQSGNGGWIARIQMLSREPLIELRNGCLDAGITFRVRQLYGANPETEIDVARLTPQQRNTVLTAYRFGYYDVPRGISQSELADELGVSTSAISQQLRRATGQLIASTFAVDQD
ncbi:helix-turn-helix domain-containing protein [Haladaptatus sp. NG-WS-4]